MTRHGGLLSCVSSNWTSKPIKPSVPCVCFRNTPLAALISCLLACLEWLASLGFCICFDFCFGFALQSNGSSSSVGNPWTHCPRPFVVDSTWLFVVEIEVENIVLGNWLWPLIGYPLIRFQLGSSYWCRECRFLVLHVFVGGCLTSPLAHL